MDRVPHMGTASSLHEDSPHVILNKLFSNDFYFQKFRHFVTKTFETPVFIGVSASEEMVRK